jgi:hypothetical protein
MLPIWAIATIIWITALVVVLFRSKRQLDPSGSIYSFGFDILGSFIAWLIWSILVTIPYLIFWIVYAFLR